MILDHSDLERLFLDALPTIDAVSNSVCRQRGMFGDDADEFIAHVRARFVESGYSQLAEFKGDCSLRGYLAVVIVRLANDQVVARDGRWRPSAAAIRSGPVAVHLERLITKSGCSLDDAVAQILAGGDQPYSEKELRTMARSLPLRAKTRPPFVSLSLADDLYASGSFNADASTTHAERTRRSELATRALSFALETLAPEDRLMVSMRFIDGHSLAEVARVLRIEQKPLYRRLPRALRLLQRALTQFGVTADDARDVATGTES